MLHQTHATINWRYLRRNRFVAKTKASSLIRGGCDIVWVLPSEAVPKREVKKPETSKDGFLFSLPIFCFWFSRGHSTIFPQQQANPSFFSREYGDLFAGGCRLAMPHKFGFERLMKILSPLQRRTNKNSAGSCRYGG